MRLAVSLSLALFTSTPLLAAAGLVAHLSFNDDLLDETALHSGASVSEPLFDVGVAGNALSVRSADGAATLANPQGLEWGSNFTFSAWVQTTYAGEQVVVYRGDPDHFVSPALQFNVQAAKFFIYGDAQGGYGADFTTTHGISVNDGQWHHLAVTYRAAGTPHFTLYLDGNAKKPGDAGSTFSGDFVTKTNKANSIVRIGGRDAESGAYHFNGLIDDVQIYDRTLTTDQIKELFATPGQVLQLPLAPVIIVDPVPSQTVATGSNVSFSVQAEARTALAYQWQRNGTNLPTATNATLVLSAVTLGQAGTYKVVVSNGAGTATSAASILVVGGAPELALNMYAGITLKGTTGLKYRIDYENNVGPAGQWTVLTNLVLTTDATLFFDLQSTGSVKRAYRAVLAP